MEEMNRHETPEYRASAHTISALDREEVVDAVIKGLENKRHQIIPVRTGRVLHLAGCLRSGMSGWTTDARKKRAGSTS